MFRTKLHFYLKYFYALATLLLLVLSAAAQSGFQKHYDYNNKNLVLARHISTGDGGFLIYHPAHNDTIFILKTDKDGKQLWGKKIPAGQDTLVINLTCVTELPDGALVFGGSLDPGIQNSHKDFFFMKLTKDGAPVWTKFINRWGMDDEIVALKYDNNVIYAAGQGASLRALPSDVVYLRLDADGNILSSDAYFLEQHKITDLEVKDGWAYISGTHWQPGGQDDPMLFTADANGKFRNQFVFNVNGLNSGQAVTKAGNNIYLSGNTKNGNKESIFYIKISGPENPAPELFEIAHSYRISNSAVKGDAQGNIYLSGGLDSSAWLVSNAFITKIDAAGKISWARIYKGNSNQLFNSLSVAQNGNIAACGVTLIDHMQQNNIYLLAAGKDGITACKESTVNLGVNKLSTTFTREVMGGGNTLFYTAYSITLAFLANTFEETTVCFSRSFTASDTAVCLGKCIVMKDENTKTLSRKWLVENAAPLTSDSAAQQEICFTSAGYHKVILVTRKSTGTDSAVRYFRVYALPKAEAGADVVICNGDAARLSASGGVAYHWFPDHFIADASTANPKVSPGKATTYFVRVTNENGCENIDSVTVNIKDCSLSFFIPNAFTPGSDKLNHYFEVVGENIKEIRMRIYNRWKQRIFDERGSSPRWDGHFNSVRVPEGFYLYIIEITGTDGRKELRKGTVYVTPA